MASAPEDHRRRGEADAERVGEVIGYERADDADEHDDGPIDGTHVPVAAHLHEECDEEDGGHHIRRADQAEVQVRRQKVRDGFTDRGREDLNDPEEDGNVGDFVAFLHEAASFSSARRCGARVSLTSHRQVNPRFRTLTPVAASRSGAGVPSISSQPAHARCFEPHGATCYHIALKTLSSGLLP